MEMIGNGMETARKWHENGMRTEMETEWKQN